MAIANAEIQIKWAAANSKSVAAAGNATSDAITGTAAAIGREITVKAVNAGAAVSGDTLDIYLLRSSGDPDADPDVANEFDTTGHGALIGTLDTFVDDPAILTVEIGAVWSDAKLYVENNSAALAITASAQIKEKTA